MERTSCCGSACWHSLFMVSAPICF
ncbi:hypothetical protein [Duncaniella sp.]